MAETQYNVHVYSRLFRQEVSSFVALSSSLDMHDWIANVKCFIEVNMSNS